MKKEFCFYLSLFARLLAAVCLGVLLLALVYSIPADMVESNVRRSAAVIEEEGLYPELTPWATSNLDTWTDSIMLLEAAYPGSGSVFEDAVMVRRAASGEGFPNETLVRLFRGDGGYDYTEAYPQYWHGYLVLLRPLLTVLDYSGIRLLNGMLQLLLDAAVVFFLWRRGRQAYILPYLLSLGMLMPLALAKCLQFSSCFYLFSLASLLLLLLPQDRRRESRVWKVFFYTGIAAAYFDFLTYPIATFGVPAVFCLILQEPRPVRENIRHLGKAFLVWILGYGSMWLGKLAIGSIITGANLFRAAGDHVGYWLNRERWFSVGYVLYYNVRDYVYTPVTFAALAWAVWQCLRLISGRQKTRRAPGSLLRTALPYLLLCLLPFLWYLVLLNPSGVHHFFTSKACVVCAFSGLSMLTALK